MRNMVSYLSEFENRCLCLSPVILDDDGVVANSSSSLGANNWHRIEPDLNLGISVWCLVVGVRI